MKTNQVLPVGDGVGEQTQNQRILIERWGLWYQRTVDTVLGTYFPFCFLEDFFFFLKAPIQLIWSSLTPTFREYKTEHRADILRTFSWGYHLFYFAVWIKELKLCDLAFSFTSYFVSIQLNLTLLENEWFLYFEVEEMTNYPSLLSHLGLAGPSVQWDTLNLLNDLNEEVK